LDADPTESDGVLDTTIVFPELVEMARGIYDFATQNTSHAEFFNNGRVREYWVQLFVMAPFDGIVFGVIQGECDRLKTSGNTTDADKLRNQSELFITRSQFCGPLEGLVKQELDQTVNLFQHSLRFNPAELNEQCEVISWKLPSIFTDQSIGSGEPDLLIYTPEMIAMRRGDNWETKILNNASSRSISICEDTDQIKGQRTPTKPVIHYVLEKAGPGYGLGVNALHAISDAVSNTAVLITADEFDDLSEANIQATFERSEKEGAPFRLRGEEDLGVRFGNITIELESREFSP
jgi:hypothetical protein